MWGASEVWDSYWVPVYGSKGSMTGKRTNIAYSVDLVRGLDVYTVDLPGDEAVTPTALDLGGLSTDVGWLGRPGGGARARGRPGGASAAEHVGTQRAMLALVGFGLSRRCSPGCPCASPAGEPVLAGADVTGRP